jgi:glutathione S-transferase
LSAAGRGVSAAPALLRLYDFHESGNAYKVRLLLTLLEIPFERVHLDILQGETRTPGFLTRNPNGRVPLVEWPDGRSLAESNAICFHLARGSRYLPDDPFEQAQVLQWMSFEQYSHEPYIAVVRFWHFAGELEAHRDELEVRVARGYDALGVMERELAGREWLVGESASVADLALYAYTHVAHEGGFDLERFPAVRAWLGRVAAEPGYVGIEEPTGTLVEA